jgi:hypothetical protein
MMTDRNERDYAGLGQYFSCCGASKWRGHHEGCDNRPAPPPKDQSHAKMP